MITIKIDHVFQNMTTSEVCAAVNVTYRKDPTQHFMIRPGIDYIEISNRGEIVKKTIKK